MTNVFYSRKIDDDSITSLFEKLLEENPIAENDKIAVKVHFGEKGNSRFVAPEKISSIIMQLKNLGAQHYLTDTNTLYRGMRLNTKDHLKIANEHGFNSLDTPIIIADDKDYKDIKINKMHFSSCKIPKLIDDSSALVAISHFKGHMVMSFGGAIKNIGMGCATRPGKLAIHSKIKPIIEESCTACGVCRHNCAYDAIEILGMAKILTAKCTGCAKCISVCPNGSVSIPWHGATSKEVQERTAEYALAVSSNKKTYYINFVNNITKDCDCLSDSRIISDDVGVVASLDPVAADKACFDLVYKMHGNDIFEKNTGYKGDHIFEYAEKIGLGSKEYKLIEL